MNRARCLCLLLAVAFVTACVVIRTQAVAASAVVDLAFDGPSFVRKVMGEIESWQQDTINKLEVEKQELESRATLTEQHRTRLEDVDRMLENAREFKKNEDRKEKAKEELWKIYGGVKTFRDTLNKMESRVSGTDTWGTSIVDLDKVTAYRLSRLKDRIDQASKVTDVIGQGRQLFEVIKELDNSGATPQTSRMLAGLGGTLQALELLEKTLAFADDPFGSAASHISLITPILSSYVKLSIGALNAAGRLEQRFKARNQGLLLDGIHNDGRVEAFDRQFPELAGQRDTLAINLIPGIRDAYGWHNGGVLVWDPAAQRWYSRRDIDPEELMRRYIFFATHGNLNPTPRQVLGQLSDNRMIGLVVSADPAVVPPGGRSTIKVRAIRIDGYEPAALEVKLHVESENVVVGSFGRIESPIIGLEEQTIWQAPDVENGIFRIVATLPEPEKGDYEIIGEPSVRMATAGMPVIIARAEPVEIETNGDGGIRILLTNSDGEPIAAKGSFSLRAEPGGLDVEPAEWFNKKRAEAYAPFHASDVTGDFTVHVGYSGYVDAGYILGSNFTPAETTVKIRVVEKGAAEPDCAAVRSSLKDIARQTGALSSRTRVLKGQTASIMEQKGSLADRLGEARQIAESGRKAGEALIEARGKAESLALAVCERARDIREAETREAKSAARAAINTAWTELTGVKEQADQSYDTSRKGARVTAEIFEQYRGLAKRLSDARSERRTLAEEYAVVAAAHEAMGDRGNACGDESSGRATVLGSELDEVGALLEQLGTSLEGEITEGVADNTLLELEELSKDAGTAADVADVWHEGLVSITKQADECVELARREAERSLFLASQQAIVQCRFEAAGELMSHLPAGARAQELRRQHGELERREREARELYRQARQSYADCTAGRALAQLEQARALSPCESTRQALQARIATAREAAERQQRTRQLFRQARTVFAQCDYERAERILDQSLQNARCEGHRNTLQQAKARLKQARKRERQTRTLYQDAAGAYRNCRFEDATAKLQTALGNTQCSRYRARLDQALERVQAAAEQEEAPRALYRQANAAYRSCELDAALGHLDQALELSRCEANRRQLSSVRARVLERQQNEIEARRLVGRADALLARDDRPGALRELNAALGYVQCEAPRQTIASRIAALGEDDATPQDSDSDTETVGVSDAEPEPFAVVFDLHFPTPTELPEWLKQSPPSDADEAARARFLEQQLRRLEHWLNGLSLADVRIEKMENSDPLLIHVGEGALEVYPRAMFSPGEPFALPLSGTYQGQDQSRLDFTGALLLTVREVYETSAVSGVASSSSGRLDDPEGMVMLPQEQGARFDAGPLTAGWSEAHRQQSLELLKSIIPAMFLVVGGVLPDCFVATAVYADPRASQLTPLRKLRDEYLMQTPNGRLMVRAYYRHGPALALKLHGHPRLRATLRAGLDRLASWLEQADLQSPSNRYWLGLVTDTAAVLVPLLLRDDAPDATWRFQLAQQRRAWLGLSP